MAKKQIKVFGIDPQVDFCDIPKELLPCVGGVAELPALPVVGAHADMLRAAEMVKVGRGGISSIVLTMDSHNYVGIERSTFWRYAGSGEAVAGLVTVEDVASGKVEPVAAANVDRALKYIKALNEVGKVLYVWPVHAEVGTWGHQIHPSLMEATRSWEAASQRPTRKEFKGRNPWTEHYSVFKAELVDPQDPETAMNWGLVNALVKDTDLLAVFGEAGSHCVPASVRDLVGSTPSWFWRRIVLIADAMSAVPGFESEQDAFLREMEALGVQRATCEEFTKELLSNARA